MVVVLDRTGEASIPGFGITRQPHEGGDGAELGDPPLSEP